MMLAGLPVADDAVDGLAELVRAAGADDRLEVALHDGVALLALTIDERARGGGNRTRETFPPKGPRGYLSQSPVVTASSSPVWASSGVFVPSIWLEVAGQVCRDCPAGACGAYPVIPSSVATGGDSAKAPAVVWREDIRPWSW